MPDIRIAIVMSMLLPSLIFSQESNISETSSNSQNIVHDIDSLSNHKTRFNYSSLIVPSVFLTYGLLAVQNDGLEFLNRRVQEEVLENIDNKTTIDDFTQYTPFVSVYALNLMGINGKNNFKDRTIILGTAYLTMGISVNSLKYLTNEKRPDGSTNNTFPSGHTATAFMGAEFLY
ncbi:phosphatase PAP2 family protein [Maribacter ulvicola]|uniref:PAP2 superfamily protein n=1 Tax=Maribacter ulvicola TaxID=228959 RepID=A0A1N6QTT4_9FLAO|nr:hypothetical protein [Maribacter ulvicola]SIQ19958.1 hypothetical protein SAMN05421797_1011020 [Maribacter ulvicola]